MCDSVYLIISCDQASGGQYIKVISSEYCLLQRFCWYSCQTPGPYFSKLNSIHKLVQNRRNCNAYGFEVHQLNNHTHPEEDELSCNRRYYMTPMMRVHNVCGNIHMHIAAIHKSWVLSGEISGCNLLFDHMQIELYCHKPSGEDVAQQKRMQCLWIWSASAQ